jgi:hypothetical protein
MSWLAKLLFNLTRLLRCKFFSEPIEFNDETMRTQATSARFLCRTCEESKIQVL